MNEIRKDLYTKNEYAKKVGLSPSYIGRLVREKKLSVVVINGAELIKVK